MHEVIEDGRREIWDESVIHRYSYMKSKQHGNTARDALLPMEQTATWKREEAAIRDSKAFPDFAVPK